MAKLRFLYSPMEGGKSAMLLIEAHNFEKRNIGFLCMKPSIDNRENIDKIYSRIGIKRECITIDPDDNIFNIVNDIIALIDKANELCTLIGNMKQADTKAKSTKKGFLTAFDYALLLDDISVKDIIKIDSMVNYSEGITEVYKKVDNCIFGATFETCPKELVPIKMQELVHKYNTEWALDIPAFDFDMDFDTPEEKEQAKEAYIRAFYEREAKFHIEFERIHPFEDGNGRTGRIITNAHLLHNNLAPIIITSSMKNIYLNCISNRDYQTLGNLFRMLASVTTSQLIAYYRKVKGISPDDIGGKRGKPNK